MPRTVGSDPSDTLAGYIAAMDNRLSERSKREYTSRVQELSKRIQRRTGRAEALTADLLIEQLGIEVASRGIADATFRLYKSAVMYWLGQQAQAVIAAGGDPYAYSSGYAELRALRYSAAAPAGGAAPGRLKFFPPECAQALSKYAEERGHRAPNAVRAAAFVRANLLVGLRPSEWFDASFASYLVRDGDGQLIAAADGRPLFEHMLVVQNAKHTHGRANGHRRELILHDITTEELKALMHFAEIAQRFRDRQPAEIDAKKLNNLFYRPINNMLRRALTQVGYAQRDIPSIYSTRHQVVSDFKASGYDKRSVAAFFGHASEKTHQAHYGHKKHGSRAVTFRPSPESAREVAVRSVTKRVEVMRPDLAAEAERWAEQRQSRKPSSIA